MQTTRRLFLKSGALALASVGLAPGFGPAFLRSTVFADEPRRNGRAAGGRKILICIFQRGAVDGLSMVVPHGDPFYYEHRTLNGIAIPRTGDEGVVDLDGRFGLHPALAMLAPIYKSGHMAAIHAVGSPNPTRSHFDAQDFMETAMPGDKSARDGWLTRTLRACPEDAANEAAKLRAIAMTPQLPRSFMGDDEALAIGDLRTFGVGGGATMQMAAMPRRRQNNAMAAMNGDPTAGFEALYDDAVGDVLHGAGKETFEAVKLLNSIKPASYVPAGGAKYPNGRFGDSLKQIAQLIKSNVGLEVAFAEVGGWDTHANQGSSQGTLARRLNELGNGLAALYTDLGDRMSDVVVITMSEFGRTVRQNGNSGTDHGHGTCFLTLGGDIQGGRVLGDWPGLAPEQLYEKRDLAVTTDFRDVFGEIAMRHLGVQDLKSVLPNYQPAPAKFRGLLRV